MFEEAINKMIKEETDKFNDQQLADLNGQRVINNFSTYINQNIEALLKIEDAQELLTKSVSLLRNSPKTLQDIVTELNSQRREQRARVIALQDSLDVVNEVSKKIEREENRVKEVAEKIKKGEDLNKRKPGERPEALKTRRKAEAFLEEESEDAETERGVEIEQSEEIKTSQ